MLRMSSTGTDFLLPVDFPSVAAIMVGSVSVVPDTAPGPPDFGQLLATFLKIGGGSKG